MKVWLDAITAKDALLMVKIAEMLDKKGIPNFITARNYDYTQSILSRHNRTYYDVGRHGGKELSSKLDASIERMKDLKKVANKEKPDWHISLSSPEATRIAFGLGVKIIQLNDAPHSYWVNRLTLPLAKWVIIPLAIPLRKYIDFVPYKKIITYKGVDEIAWLRDFEPQPNVLAELGLKPRKYIVFRPPEIYASYYPTKVETQETIEQILSYPKVVALPRYQKQKEELSKRDNVVILPGGLDFQSLLYYSNAVVTGGATISREAALLGVPSVCLFPKPLDIESWLSGLGYPLYKNPTKNKLEELLYKPASRKPVTIKLESPIDVIERLLE